MRIADLNNDGFHDLIKAKSGGTSNAWLNNGSGWKQNSTWNVLAL